METATIQFAETENGGVALASTKNTFVDLFVNLVRGCDKNYAQHMISKCWNIDPVKTLKLIAQTRDCRNGKGERDIYFKGLISWLKENLYLTYTLNIVNFTKNYGRWKDILVADELKPRTGFEMEELVKQLNKDWEEYKVALAEGRKPNLSLAAKFAPTESNMYHEQAKKCARLMFPHENDFQKQYRKVISALRGSNGLNVTEVHMASKNYEKLDYQKVPAGCMRLHGRRNVHVPGKDKEETQPGAFLRNDKERFTEYLEKCEKGQAKINSSGIQPHQLVSQYIYRLCGRGEEAFDVESFAGHLFDESNPDELVCDNPNVDKMIELQWKAMVEKLSTKQLQSAISVVDVSGSMSGEPMQVAIALGLITAEKTVGPYKGKIITFSESPTLVNVDQKTLYERVSVALTSKWGMNTNFEKVFDLLLKKAVNEKIPNDDMVKTVFVFTDMQFDDAKGNNRDKKETLFETIKTKYTNAGYTMPKMVFWNLRPDNRRRMTEDEKVVKESAFPVDVDEQGTAYVSGFSAELLKVFMTMENFTPETILDEMLKSYEVQVSELELGQVKEVKLKTVETDPEEEEKTGDENAQVTKGVRGVRGGHRGTGRGHQLRRCNMARRQVPNGIKLHVGDSDSDSDSDSD